jgi:thiamine-phosphate pyrophosphorylase
MTFPRIVYLAGTQDFPSPQSFFAFVERLCRAGLPWLQYREKTLPDRPRLEMADLLRRLTRETGTLFTVNDRPDLALFSGADGVHLGQNDLPSVRLFRKPPSHLGISTHNEYEIRRALLFNPDYLGIGPIFATATKETGIEPRGLGAIRESRKLTSLPLVAIGGIRPEDKSSLLGEGASTLAVSGALTRAADPVAVLQSFLAD